MLRLHIQRLLQLLRVELPEHLEQKIRRDLDRRLLRPAPLIRRRDLVRQLAGLFLPRQLQMQLQPILETALFPFPNLIRMDTRMPIRRQPFNNLSIRIICVPSSIRVVGLSSGNSRRQPYSFFY